MLKLMLATTIDSIRFINPLKVAHSSLSNHIFAEYSPAQLCKVRQIATGATP